MNNIIAVLLLALTMSASSATENDADERAALIAIGSTPGMGPVVRHTSVYVALRQQKDRQK